MPIEIAPANQMFCAQCGKPVQGEHKCGRCGKTFCTEHSHLLALSHTGGMNIVLACEQCIENEHLYVIDTNHPFYMKGKQK